MISFPPGQWRTRRELERWLKHHRARLVRLAWAWSGDPVLAEDLVQEAHARAVRSSRTLRDTDRIDAWVARIMHRVYLDHLKSAARREQPELDMDRMCAVDSSARENSVGPERAAMARQRDRSVRDAVALLPLGQRQVVTLVDLEEFSYADCAQALDIPVGTVMSRLNRARAALRKRLATEYGVYCDTGLRRVK